jgi:predicted RNase H-like HicB family nuclease
MIRLRQCLGSAIFGFGDPRGSEQESPMRYRVLIEQDEDGFFVAEVPSLPGCISQGETREEALANIREAITGYLESLNDHQEPIPPSIHEEIVEV